ncbi:MAG TPA: alpha-hydroxy acid oxidase [Candidatus Saccharimonadales bacterium]|jgi:4-hydroxymandelate oxidase|nr:alpha-hydroxy acid oxidase [Candidatus Saccharimonadales bacterium]
MSGEKPKIENVLHLQEFEALAQPGLPEMAYAYISGGAADELTMRANSQDWKSLRLCHRVLVDVSEINLRTEIFGQAFDAPVLLAPTAFHRLCHPQGELATAQGANQGGAGMVLSSFSTFSVEEVAATVKQPLWFQLYFQADRGLTEQMVRRAEAAGCKALCLTVDTPVLGARHRESRTSFALPPDFKLPNLNLGAVSHRPVRSAIYSELLNPKLNWKDVEWLCSVAKIPVLLKGVLNPEDAARSLDTGVGGIIVSNHGARNLDTLPSTAEALPRVAEKVNGRLPILVDGGIRRGTDVLKALALGAKAVLIGRPYLYALAYAGAEGVARAIEILHTELMMAMALTGRTSVSQIDHSVLWR